MAKIHESIRALEGLSSAQRILLNQIVYLSARRPCFATDKYFQRFFAQKLGDRISVKTINRWISLFAARGLIRKHSAGNRRTLEPIFLQQPHAHTGKSMTTPATTCQGTWDPHALAAADASLKKFFNHTRRSLD